MYACPSIRPSLLWPVAVGGTKPSHPPLEFPQLCLLVSFSNLCTGLPSYGSARPHPRRSAPCRRSQPARRSRGHLSLHHEAVEMSTIDPNSLASTPPVDPDARSSLNAPAFAEVWLSLALVTIAVATRLMGRWRALCLTRPHAVDSMFEASLLCLRFEHAQADRFTSYDCPQLCMSKNTTVEALYSCHHGTDSEIQP